MSSGSAVLARYEGFGSVVCCSHGMVHVQLGMTTLTFTEAQYHRFVAMLADSAANFETRRQPSLHPRTQRPNAVDANRAETDLSDFRQH